MYKYLASLLYVTAFLSSCDCQPSESEDNELVVCTGDTYFKIKKDGRAVCMNCPGCRGGGLGWNESFVRGKGEHGFTNCFPCEKCPSGSYRNYDSYESRCKRCVLNCRRLNRYESVECGGDNEGHCGDCLPGFMTKSAASNSLCDKFEEKDAHNRPFTNVPATGLEEEQQTWRDGSIDKHSHFDLKNPFLIVSIVCILTLAIVVPCLVKWYRKGQIPRKSGKVGTSGRDLANDASSSQKLISSDLKLYEDNDLEVDAADSLVRGEVSTYVSEIKAIGYQGSDAHLTLGEIRRGQNVIYFRNRILGVNDQTLIVASRNISTERRYELFHSYLKLEEAQTKPEEELWEKHIISFPHYILDVLILWIRINAEKADLKWLVSSLELASFHDVADKILDLPENKHFSSTFAVNNELPSEKSTDVEIYVREPSSPIATSSEQNVNSSLTEVKSVVGVEETVVPEVVDSLNSAEMFVPTEPEIGDSHS